MGKARYLIEMTGFFGCGSQKPQTIDNQVFDLNPLFLLAFLVRRHCVWQKEAFHYCATSSDVNLFSNLKGVVDFDSEIPDCALDFGVSQQQLNCTKIPCALVNHGCLGAPQ
jgi:hypothetical protein